jgi:NADPH2:quinone reductase
MLSSSVTPTQSAGVEPGRIRLVRTTAFAGPEAIAVVLGEPPSPGPGEVLVGVEASSATTSDSIVRRGLNPYLGEVQPPFTLGYDHVGVVREVGVAVDGVAVGDRVVAITRWGSNADAVVLPARAVTRIESALDAVLVEPMVMTGATAAAMVRRLAPVQAGHVVYVQGASGGVGLIAVQAALLLGARVVASASATKHDRLRSLGADVLDYGDPALVDAILALAPGGVDVALDAAGGAGIGRAGATLADGGSLVSFGFSEASRRAAGRTPEVMAATAEVFAAGARAIEEINASPRGLRASQFDVTSLRDEDPEGYAEDVNWLLEQVEQRRLAPVVRAMALEGAAEAHRELDAGRVAGRIVLDHRL